MSNGLGIERFRDPTRYVPDDDLIAAVQVAIMLRQPLLLTGEPGTGKTQLAAWVAHKVERPLIRFVAKSTTSATDLLYRFDAVREFRESQRVEGTIKATHPRRYLTFQGLGRAIALTYPMDALEMKAAWDEEANCLPAQQVSREAKQTASVVLVDEIDKAPRDVPNDLLAEFETGEFLIPELNVRLKIQDGLHPIVIATSNSEKALPDAFLRRCIFHHISIPTTGRLQTIIRQQLPSLDLNEPFARDALELFDKLNKPSSELPLRKKPSLSELLGLLLFISDRTSLPDRGILREGDEELPAVFRRIGLKSGLANQDLGTASRNAAFSQLLSILFKTKDDQDAAREWLCEQWNLPKEIIVPVVM
jgi:MoxR-like ATPase